MYLFGASVIYLFVISLWLRTVLLIVFPLPTTNFDTSLYSAHQQCFPFTSTRPNQFAYLQDFRHYQLISSVTESVLPEMNVVPSPQPFRNNTSTKIMISFNHQTVLPVATSSLTTLYLLLPSIPIVPLST